MKKKIVKHAVTAVKLLKQGRIKDLRQKIHNQLRARPPSAKAKRGEGSSAPVFRKPEDAFFHRLSDIGMEAFLGSGAEIVYPAVEKPQVSIILVLFNKAELTLGCLRSLLEHLAVGIEVIIVDNASSDQTHLLLDRVRGARIFRNTDNVGFLLACNQAAEVARGETLLFLNNDTVVMPGAIAVALETLKSDRRVGAVGARIINLDGRLQEAGSIIWNDGACYGYGRGDDPEAGPYMFRRDVDYCSGAFLLTARALFEKMGGFDRAFAPAYYEETDFCMRLKENGLRVVYEPRAVLLHFEFGSAASTSQSMKLMEGRQQIFRVKHAVSLESQRPNHPDEILRARIATAAPAGAEKKRLLWIEDRAPHPFLGAGFPRSYEFLRVLLAEGYQVTLFPTLISDEEWHSVYQDIPREVEVMLGYGSAGLPEFLRERRGYYPTIVVSRPHNMEAFQPVWRKHPDWFADTRILYDAEALFSFRDRSYAELSGEALSETEFSHKLRREIALTDGVAGVFAVSPHEKTLFERHGLKEVRVLSHAIDFEPTPAPFSERRDFIFMGAIHYHPSPNSDSVLWFAREVFPRIQSELGADVRFRVVGLNKSLEVAALASPSIRILGKVDDPRSVFDSARVFVAPTRFAAGIPLKCLEAAAYGVPIVGTSLLVSQLGWNDGEEILGAPSADPALFARKCIEAYTRQELWDRLRSSALARIHGEHSRRAFSQAVRSLLD